MVERGVGSLFGGSKRAGWNCSLVRHTIGEPSRSFHGEGRCVERRLNPARETVFVPFVVGVTFAGVAGLVRS